MIREFAGYNSKNFDPELRKLEELVICLLYPQEELRIKNLPLEHEENDRQSAE